MSDYLDSLPTDELPINPEEEVLVNKILSKDATSFHRFILEMREPIVGGIVFLILNTPQVRSFIQSSVPYTNKSSTSLLLFNTLIFIVALFVIKNCNLALQS